MRKLAVGLGALALLTVLAACRADEGDGEEEVVAPAPAAAAPAVAAPAQPSLAFAEPQAYFVPGVNTPTPAPAGFFSERPELFSIAEALVPPSGSFTGVPVTRADFGDQWPFSVESGVAECQHRGRLALLRVGEEQYPLNGRRMFGLADPFDIWLDDPNNLGEKMSLEAVAVVSIGECDPEEAFFHGAKVCLAGGTGIDTPNGYITVADLRVGMEVWTVDASGARVAAVIHKVANNAAPEDHHMVDVVLDDGRRLLASPGHPLADGRTLQELVPGDRVDGAQVMSVERVSYEEGTYDLLPSGDTGHYWANGIPVGSTIPSPLGCRA